MFTMHAPKFLWGEVVKTTAYLINHMPSRILNFKTPIECLSGSNPFIVTPKVFGCVCFVHDYRNSVGKLDPHAVCCIFVGYSPTQKGYRCWCPAERRFSVSMDVTFRENESFYSPTFGACHPSSSTNYIFTQLHITQHLLNAEIFEDNESIHQYFLQQGDYLFSDFHCVKS